MTTKMLWSWAAASGIAAAIFVGGSTPAIGAGNDAPPVATTTPAKGGAQLWAENCARCHNFRSPTAYSNAQSEVAMQHMRVITNLTAEEYTKILAFLKSAKK